MPTRSGILRLTACLASGASLSLAFAPFDCGFVAWVALMPMLVALWTLSGKRVAWKGFGLGWLAGFAFFAINVRWLATVAPVAPYALGAYLAFYFAAFGAFTAKWGNPWRGFSRGWRGDLTLAFANAAFWAGLEWLRSWVITGFGWNSLGVSLHRALVLVQGADLFGALGLSLVMLLVQILVLLAARRFKQAEKKPALALVGAAAVTLLLLAGYGALRLATVEKGPSIPLRALLVQTNIAQVGHDMEMDPIEMNLAYEDATGAALEPLQNTERFPDWVVWPESSLGGQYLTTDDGQWGMWPANIDTVERVRTYGDFSLMLGLTELQGVVDHGQLVQKDHGLGWNSMMIMEGEQPPQVFRKHHLVIFGETIPFVDTVPWLKAIYEQQSGMEYGGAFTAGVGFEPLTANIRGTTVGVIPSICFEDTVPRLERKFVRPGPQIIVNVTNDAWFHQSEAADQHFNNAMFRAIELRRPMLRCANTGVSGSISPVGRTQRLVDEHGSHFTVGSLLAEVAIPQEPAFSLYAVLGDWPIIALGVVGLGIGWKRRKD